MKISFEVDIKKYKTAVADGWKARFGEEIDPSKITLTDTVQDLQNAMYYLDDDDIQNVRMEE